MRHRRSGRRFSRTASHRKAMFGNMATSLLWHEQIITTLPKAKDLRPVVEKLITKAKKGGLANRREVYKTVKEDDVVRKLFDTLAERYKDRPGGYVRVLKAGFRYGDMTPMAVIELVDRDPAAKGALLSTEPERDADGDDEEE